MRDRLIMPDELSIRRRTVCFVEDDATIPVLRRAMAEALGTLLLVLAIVGAGVTVQRVAPGQPGLAVLIRALAAGGALMGLILAFGKVSGGHFNPLITGTQWLDNERGIGCTVAYVAAQCAGAFTGAMLANVLFVQSADAHSLVGVTPQLAASELVASAALMIVVFACSRSHLNAAGPVAVGGWLTASIIAMPSGSFANPALTVAALVATGPIALSPLIAGGYVAAQLIGAVIAFAFIRFIYPLRASKV